MYESMRTHTHSHVQEKRDDAKRQRDAMETKLQIVEEERDTALGDLQGEFYE